MAKLNVYSLKTPKREVTNFLVTDPNNPGCEVSISIKEPNLATVLRMEEVASTYKEMYLKADKNGELLSVLLDSGQYHPLESEIVLASAIYVAQCQEDIYEVPEIIVLMHTMESGMFTLIDHVRKAIEKYEQIMENPTNAVIIPLSQSMQNSINESLLSTSESTNSSGQLMND